MNASADVASRSARTQAILIVLGEGAGLVCVLLLAAYVRLINLGTDPGWYSDEGTLIDIAQQLLRGRWQYMAITQSTLIAARLPLFPMLLSAVFRWFEPGIVGLRALTGCLGVISVGLVFVIVRRVNRKGYIGLPLMTAFILAIYPEAVLHSRLGFSYNLLAVLALLACLGLWSYLEKGRVGWLILAACSIGLGIVSDLMMVGFILPALLILSSRRWKKAAWALVVMAVPGAIYAVWMLATVPGAFIFDARFTLSRLGTISGLIQLPAVLFNYLALISRNPWALLGVIGLFLVRPSRWRGILLLMVFLPLVSLGRTTWYGAGLGTYYITALLPLFAIGMGSLLWLGGLRMLHIFESGLSTLMSRWGWHEDHRGWLRNRVVALISSLGLFLIVVSPLLLSTAVYFVDIGGRRSTPVDAVLVEAHDARQVLEYLNTRLQPDDLVIASPAIAWGVEARTADFQQTLAAQGIATQHFPADIPANRFAYDPRYQSARYVVVDRIWRNWAALNMPEVAAMLAEAETWPLEFSAGEVQVYRNPAK